MGISFLSMLTSDPGLPGGPTGPGSPSAPCKPKNVAIFTLLPIYDIIIYLVEETSYESGQTLNIKQGCGSLVGGFLSVLFFLLINCDSIN